MSQDKLNSQPPLSPKSGAGQSETTVEQETQTAQNTMNPVQAVLKAQSVKALRGTIQVLEGVLVKLEAEPRAGTLSSTATRKIPSFLDKLRLGWSGALAKIRSLLPQNLALLSDTALTGIIAGIAVIIVWTTSALLPGKPAEVANVPTENQAPKENITTAPELTAPTAPEPTAPELTVPTAPEPTAPQLTAPTAPEPVEVLPAPEPVPTPSATLELTPEQNLIASIENQVAEITAQYVNGLIQSIQANFQNSNLTIKVSDEWYNIPQSQQDKLAARMLERAKDLDFSHLEISDTQGKLLARSPVVGTDMVILKRQALSEYEQQAKS